MKRTLGGLVLAALAGCGGGDDGTALEGIYTISEWTRNDASCTQMGPSILPQPDTALYLKDENFLGAKFLNGVRCADVAECEELAGDDDTINLGEYYFDEGDLDTGYSGGSFFGTSDDQGNCSGEFDQDLLSGSPGEQILLETWTYPVDGFQEDADGFCRYEDARAAIEGRDCIAVESIRATFASELP